MSLVAQFLGQINQQVRAQQGDALASWLQVAPESDRQYHELAAELRRQHPQPSHLDAAIDRHLPEDDDDAHVSPWSGFRAFMRDYLVFWRDVDYNDLVAAHELLNTLVK